MIFLIERIKLFVCTGGEHNTIFFYFFSYLFSYLKIIINIIKNIIKKNNEILSRENNLINKCFIIIIW